ncbi:SseB family protein [Arcanobacterium canis]|uniref:SseB family protein n=1 Tax=Arcanobacterium canis TaxID=999183 RepID=A0ABY8G0R7_9ACTO|nr:SseB family protein [Arcanobacterium canis]WFM84077.1 SseB family protein [Arcanobacterium canis]
MAIPRDLTGSNPFAGDDGSIEPALAYALTQPEELRAKAVVSALGRVLVPVVPHPHPGRDADGGVVEHEKVVANACGTDDDSLVKIPFPGGRDSLVVFSSAQAMAAWNPQARPVPANIMTVASEALRLEIGLISLDPGLPSQMLIGRSAVVALATRTPWRAPWEDSHLAGILNDGLGDDARVRLIPGIDGTAVIELVVENADKHGVLVLIAALTSLIESDEYLKARLDAVEIRPVLS